MKNKHENKFERCQLYPIKVLYSGQCNSCHDWIFFFFSIETIGIGVGKGLLNEEEIDFTDVFIVGIGVLSSIIEVLLDVKDGNFFTVVEGI